MKSRKPFLLRIEPDLYQALEAWAQQELRSVNGQIEYLLRQAVRIHKKMGSEPAAQPRANRPADEEPPTALP